MRRSQDRGFTLLELLLVMLLVALVLAVSYPSLSRASTAVHLRTTGRDILNTFRYAREKAVTEQIAMRVSVDQERQELILSDDLGDGARSYVLPRDVKIQRMTRAGAAIVRGPLIVRFLPNGSSDRAEVLLKSDAGAFLNIISDPIAGGARIEFGRGENSR
jgi:prepilin-type N-terminal cleavage/methylation domain-containing protein